MKIPGYIVQFRGSAASVNALRDLPCIQSLPLDSQNNTHAHPAMMVPSSYVSPEAAAEGSSSSHSSMAFQGFIVAVVFGVLSSGAWGLPMETS
jgi:hypothetical protein